MTSYIESIISEENRVSVKSQYDDEMKQFSSNQCSWCSFEFCSKSIQLAICYKKDKSTFQKIYEECVLEGSKNRQGCNKLKCGENIDDEDIKKKYKNITIVERYKTVLNKEQAEICEYLDPELRDTFFKRDNVAELGLEKIKMRLGDLSVGKFLLINRYGQSFAILGTNEKSKVLLTDSHCRTSGMIDIDDAIRYISSITPDGSDGYNLILWMFGYVC